MYNNKLKLLKKLKIYILIQSKKYKIIHIYSNMLT